MIVTVEANAAAPDRDWFDSYLCGRARLLGKCFAGQSCGYPSPYDEISACKCRAHGTLLISNIADNLKPVLFRLRLSTDLEGNGGALETCGDLVSRTRTGSCGSDQA